MYLGSLWGVEVWGIFSLAGKLGTQNIISNSHSNSYFFSNCILKKIYFDSTVNVQNQVVTRYFPKPDRYEQAVIHYFPEPDRY